jgi:hypothetical protein
MARSVAPGILGTDAFKPLYDYARGKEDPANGGTSRDSYHTLNT